MTYTSVNDGEGGFLCNDRNNCLFSFNRRGKMNTG